MKALGFGLVIGVTIGVGGARGEEAPALSRFLLEETREVALARSAAPAGVSEGAGVYVLGGEGYRAVVGSSNGFNCLVLRSFTVPTSDAKAFYDPRVLAPICYNEDASQTVMQREVAIATMVAKGLPLADIKREVDAAYAAGRLRTPQGLALAYMLSSGQWLGEGVGHWHPHVMVYAPYLKNKDTGGFAVESGWPVVDPRPGAFAFVAVPVARFVDPALPPAR